MKNTKPATKISLLIIKIQQIINRKNLRNKVIFNPTTLHKYQWFSVACVQAIKKTGKAAPVNSIYIYISIYVDIIYRVHWAAPNKFPAKNIARNLCTKFHEFYRLYCSNFKMQLITNSRLLSCVWERSKHQNLTKTHDVQGEILYTQYSCTIWRRRYTRVQRPSQFSCWRTTPMVLHSWHSQALEKGCF